MMQPLSIRQKGAESIEREICSLHRRHWLVSDGRHIRSGDGRVKTEAQCYEFHAADR